LKMREFKDLVGIDDDKIEFRDGIDFDEKDY
jgi:ribosomal RNA assembly protein